MSVDARTARQQGRDPSGQAEYRGWRIEVYRVGRRHEYQGLAISPSGRVLQGGRIGGPGAMARAGMLAGVLVDARLDDDPPPLLSTTDKREA